MDSTLRALERRLNENPFDMDARHSLTRQLLRIESGQFVVWRGDAPPVESLLAKFQFPISTAENTTENAHLLAVTGVLDLLGMLDLNPDGVFDLPSRSYRSFKGTNGLAASKLVSIERAKAHIQNPLGRSQRPLIQAGARDSLWPRVEILEQPIYDKEILLAGDQFTGTVNFFTTAVGESKASKHPNLDNLRVKHFVKTYAYTNMDMAGCLPYPKNFQITGFSLVPGETSNLDDYRLLVANSYFNMIIGTMSYLDVPTRLVAGMGCSDGNDREFRVSCPSGAHYQLDNPFSLIPLQNFRAWVSLDCNSLPGNKITLAQPLSLLCVLWGYFTREIV